MNFKVYPGARVFIKLIVGFVLACIFYSCASQNQRSTEVYKAYSGPEQSAEEVVIIRLGSQVNQSDFVDWVIIKNTHVDHSKYGSIIITPGTYLIKFGRKFNISPMIKASGSDERNWNASVTLEAGHTYIIHAERTIGQGYIIYSSIQDEINDKIIWGREYVPGPYDHLKRR